MLHPHTILKELDRTSRSETMYFAGAHTCSSSTFEKKINDKTKTLSPRHMVIMALAGVVPLSVFATYKIMKHGELGTSDIFGMIMGGLTVIGIIIMTARERKQRMTAHGD